MSRQETTGSGTPAPPGQFAPTRWTQVLRARGESAEAKAALGELCKAYWQPVFSFIRAERHDEDSARDLTQEFFARLLSRGCLGTVEPGRGRFRSYLLGAVKHFLAEERRRANAARRGGGQAAVSLEAGASADTTSELQIADPAAAVPDTHFDREWATTLVDRAVGSLDAEAQADGKGEHFAILKPWLLGEVPSLSQADAARDLGLSEGAVKVAVHRLRERYRLQVEQEISSTLDDPAEVTAEIDDLMRALSS